MGPVDPWRLRTRFDLNALVTDGSIASVEITFGRHAKVAR